MLFLSPEKLLLIAVVAIIVLGPEKLPKAARQLASVWRTVKSVRARLELEARSVFPELPDLDSIAGAVRSPRSLLDRLAEEPVSSPATQPLSESTAPAASVQLAADASFN